MPQKVLNGLDLQSQKIISLADPTGTQDAATKNYVDNVARGLDWKPSVKALASANVASLSGTTTIDGIALSAGDRVLLIGQTTASQNGPWVVNAGAWTRPTDFNDGTSATSGAAFSVEQGTSFGDKVYMLTTDGAITVGTTSLAFSTLGGGTVYTGSNGVSVSGSAITGVAVASGGLTVGASGFQVDTSKVPFKYATNVPSGSTTATITHNLGTTDVIVQVYEIGTGNLVQCDVQAATTNTVVLTNAVTWAATTYRCVVHA